MTTLFITLLWLGQSAFTAAPEHYTLELENEYVRVVRVHYGPRAISKLHEHPANPTVYVYTTDGGAMQFRHEDVAITRKPVVAGSIRFSGGALEKHVVENLTDQPNEYFRLELKTAPVDRPQSDVRLNPTGEFENGQISIRRLACAGGSCAPLMPQHPAVVVDGTSFRWIPRSEAGSRVDAVPGRRLTIVEFKSEPVGSVPPPPAH